MTSTATHNGPYLTEASSRLLTPSRGVRVPTGAEPPPSSTLWPTLGSAGISTSTRSSTSATSRTPVLVADDRKSRYPSCHWEESAPRHS